jgi:hypothetical protein
MKKVLKSHPPITKAVRFFYALFSQHVSTLNWVLFRCSLQLNWHLFINLPFESFGRMWIKWLNQYICSAGLPDGLFSNQKSKYRYF